MPASLPRIRRDLLMPGAVMCAVLASLATLTISAPDRLRYLALPVIALTTCAALLVLALANRDGRVPIDDIGIWVIAIAWLYGMLPVLTYVAMGYEFTPLMQTRMPHTPEMARYVRTVAWYYVAFGAAFALSYAWVRGRVPPLPVRIALPPQSATVAVIVLMITTTVILELVGLMYNLRAQSYVETYRVVQELPLAVRQLYNLSNGMRIVLMLGVLVLLFANWRRWWLLIALWTGYAFVNTFLTLGSRTALMVLLASCLVLYSRFIRPVGFRTAFAASVAALVVFTVMGVLRDLRSLQLGGQLVMLSPGEFEVVFMNALDLMVRADEGTLGVVPFSVRIIDFVGFIPSQLLPFEKVDPAGWLLRFYPTLAEQGGGLAFGSITQAVIGFGLVEVIVRGAGLGLICAVIYRLYRRHALNYWATAAYLWLLVLAYQPVRASTLIMFNVAAQQVVPAVVLVACLAWVLRQTLHPARPRPRSRLTPSPIQRDT